MHIKRICLLNWLCYEGKHELNLEPKAYGIIARRKDDTDSSNWVGKSAFLEAIHFALTGALNKNRKGGADGWLTHGHTTGRVQLELSDGTLVSRDREGSTRLHLHMAGRHLERDEAQIALDKLIGLTPDDFLTTFYFRQKYISRLVIADASERMSFVRSWFDLESLEKAESLMRSDLGRSIDQYDKAQVRISVLKKRLDEVHSEVPPSLSTLSLHDLLNTEVDLDREIQECDARRRDIDVKLVQAADQNKRVANHLLYQDIVRRGKELAADLHEYDIEVLKADEAKSARFVRDKIQLFVLADRQLENDRSIASKGFSGQCPVINAPCFATDQVNSVCRDWRAKVVASQGARDEALLDRDSVVEKDRHLRFKISRVEHLESELNKLRAEALKLTPDGPIGNEIDIRDLLASQQQFGTLMIDRRHELRIVRQYRAERQRLETELTKLDRESVKLKSNIDLLKTAVEVVGKNGAQRRVAERNLSEITHGANAILSDAGINLRVDMSWSHEGSGLAKNCDKCGFPFPNTTKVRECEKCGSTRGPSLVHRLEVDLSDRSGAAEDLGGLAIQMSVANYMRRARDSQWSTFMVDEPFSSLDRSNRRAGIRLFQSIIGGLNIEQAFIVSHSDDTQVFPGTIMVERDGNQSTVRVV